MLLQCWLAHVSFSLTSQIWCAAGVNLTGGRTQDGGSIVGASVFYSNPTEETIDNKNLPNDEVEKLDRELKVVYYWWLSRYQYH